MEMFAVFVMVVGIGSTVFWIVMGIRAVRALEETAHAVSSLVVESRRRRSRQQPTAES
jgi:hypothetical protein